jgi:hypothetical protein
LIDGGDDEGGDKEAAGSVGRERETALAAAKLVFSFFFLVGL